MSDLANKKCVPCEGNIPPFSQDEIHKYLKKVDGWDVLEDKIDGFHLIKNFKFDLAILGCSALDREGNMLDFDTQEILVNQSIISQADKTYLLADHTKFLRKAPVKIAPLSIIDCFFTDNKLEPELLEKCRSWNTEVRYSE